jgi:hypothetical protein
MIKININITFSNLFAFIIIGVGSVFAFLTGNAEVMMISLSLGAGLAGLHRAYEYLTKKTDNENNIDNQLGSNPNIDNPDTK